MLGERVAHSYHPAVWQAAVVALGLMGIEPCDEDVAAVGAMRETLSTAAVVPRSGGCMSRKATDRSGPQRSTAARCSNRTRRSGAEVIRMADDARCVSSRRHRPRLGLRGVHFGCIDARRDPGGHAVVAGLIHRVEWHLSVERVHGHPLTSSE